MRVEVIYDSIIRLQTICPGSPFLHSDKVWIKGETNSEGFSKCTDLSTGEQVALYRDVQVYPLEQVGPIRFRRL